MFEKIDVDAILKQPKATDETGNNFTIMCVCVYAGQGNE